MRVSKYSTNSTGYTFYEWCRAAGFRDSQRLMRFVGPKESAAWKADEDPCDWLQANLKIEEAHKLGLEADLTKKPEPPWKGKDLFTVRMRRVWTEGFHFALYSRSKDGYLKAMESGEGFVGPGVRPCRRETCGDDRCRRLREVEREKTVTEVMDR